MRKTIACIATALCAAWLPLSAGAQEPAWCAGFRETLAEIVAEDNLPGATAAVYHPSFGACEASAGFADARSSVPITPRHRLLAGSIGKTYVAAAAILLMQDGVLGFDQRVAEWLGDEAWFNRWPNAQTITIGHLLTHASGVSVDYIDRPQMIGALHETIRARTTLQALGYDHDSYAAAVSGTTPAFAAGEGFHYTDVAYVLVALIVEKATGKPLERVIAERLLQPLSLQETEPQTRRLTNVAAGYIPESIRTEFGGLPEWSIDEGGAWVYDPEYEWGGGGYAATASDLARWAHAWFGGELLSPDYLTLVRSNITDRSIATVGTRYGPGVQHIRDARHGDRYFHRGYMLGYIAVADYLPEYSMSVSLMINTVDSDYVAHHNRLVDFAANHIGRTAR